jgi:hypothetical protein
MGTHPVLRPSLLAGGIAAALCLAAIAAMVLRGRPAPRPPLQPPAAGKPTTRVRARVGPEVITEGDLARHLAVSELSVGVTGERQALEELCDRQLLLLAARESGISVGQPEVMQEMQRRELIMGAVAGAAMVKRRAATAPMRRALAMLSERGVTERDLAEETEAALVAARVRERLVYDKVRLTAAEAAGDRDTQQRIRRERGAPALARLLEEFRARWKVAVPALD